MSGDASIFGPAAAGAVLFFFVALWFFSNRRVDRSLAVLGLYLGLLDSYLKLRLGSPFITLGRDVLVVAIAGGMLLRALNSRKPLPLPPLGTLVLAFAAVVIVEAFNPTAPGLVQALAGVRSHLEFVPLFFVGFAVVRNRLQVRTLVLILVFCAAVGGVVSLIQSTLTTEQFASWGPGYRERITGLGVFGGAGRADVGAGGALLVRPFGLGSDVGAGALIAALALPGLIALLMSSSLRARLACLPLAVGIGLAVVVSGSRGATVLAVVSVVAFGALATVSKNASRAIVGLAVGAVLVFAVAQQIGSDNAAKNRASSVAPNRLLSTFSNERLDSVVKFDEYAYRYPLGVGVGTVGPATAVTGRPGESGLDSETLWNFLVIETGLIGLALILALLLRLIWLAVTRIRRVDDPTMRLYLAALAAPVVSLLIGGFGGVTTIAVPSGPYLWLVAGVLSYWLVVLPREAREAEAEAARATRTPPLDRDPELSIA